MKSKWLTLAAMVAGGIFAAKADGTSAKWVYDNTTTPNAPTLTQIVEDGVTPQVFTLNSKGELRIQSHGTATEIDLRDAALPEGTPTITWMDDLRGNSSCETLYFPEHVTGIKAYGLSSWTKLTKIVWPTEPVSFDFPTWCFNSCSSLTNFVAPEGIKTVGDSLLTGCNNLEYIHLPSTLETIGNGLPTSATLALVEPCVPESVTKLDTRCFQNSKMTNAVEIGFGKNADGTPKKITFNGDYQFLGCGGIPSMRIGPGVESLPNNFLCSISFSGNGLKYLEFGENLTTFGCYWGKVGLTNVMFKTKKTFTFTSKAFEQCTSLKEISWAGWFEYSTAANPFGNWNALQCRFIYPGNNVKWAAYVADTTKVTPWAECSDSDKSTYFTKYGADAVEPVGISIAVVNGLPRTYLVSDGTVLEGYVLNVTKPNAAFADVTVSPAISEEETYSEGTQVTLTVQEKEGVTFLGWTGDVPAGQESAKTITVTMDAAKNLTPNFEANYFVYENGAITDGQWTLVASGDAAAITVGAPSQSKANGILDLSKPIQGGGAITALAGSAFVNCAYLKEVELPTTLQTVGSKVFNGCSALERVTPLLPDGVTQVGFLSFVSMGKITGNLRIGFATDADGNVVETVLGRGWTRPGRDADSQAFNNCKMLGPKIEIGPGLYQVPPYAFLNVGSSLNQPMELVIGKGMTNAIDLAFGDIGGTKQPLTVTIEANPFNGSGAAFGTTTYRMRFILNGSKWREFVRNETYVTPWSQVDTDTRQMYWDKFPEATFGAAHPYGLTTAAAAELATGLPASSWVFCAGVKPGMIIMIR